MPTSDRKVRPRRGSRVEAIPEGLQRWFAGEVTDCWEVLLPYEQELLPSRWRAWKSAHPEAVPRSGFEWLDDPADPRHPTAAEVRTARRMLLRDLVR